MRELAKYKNSSARRKAARERKKRRTARYENEKTGPIVQGQESATPQHAVIMNDIRKKHLRLLGLTAKEYNKLKGGEKTGTT